jgi:hypothetical protein
MQNSPAELKLRGDRVMREFGREIRKLNRSRLVPARMLAWYKDNAFAPAEFVDRLVSAAIWLAQYRQSKDSMGHERAAQYADMTVRNNLPVNSVVDMSAFQRDPGYLGAMTMFKGYMNTVYNMNARMLNKFMNADSTVDRTKVFVAYVATSAVVNLFAELLAGKGPEDKEDYYAWILRKAVIGLIAPGSTLAADAVEAFYFKKSISSRRDPLASTLQGMQRAMTKAYSKHMSPDEQATELAKFVMMPLGLPTRPLRIATARKPLDVIYGKRKKRPKNIVDATQDLYKAITK